MIMIEGWRWAFARSWTQLRRLGAMMVLLLMLKRIGQMQIDVPTEIAC